jgi:hypothetical protein
MPENGPNMSGDPTEGTDDDDAGGSGLVEWREGERELGWSVMWSRRRTTLRRRLRGEGLASLRRTPRSQRREIVDGDLVGAAGGEGACGAGVGGVAGPGGEGGADAVVWDGDGVGVVGLGWGGGGGFWEGSRAGAGFVVVVVVVVVVVAGATAVAVAVVDNGGEEGGGAEEGGSETFAAFAFGAEQVFSLLMFDQSFGEEGAGVSSRCDAGGTAGFAGVGGLVNAQATVAFCLGWRQVVLLLNLQGFCHEEGVVDGDETAGTLRSIVVA